jgi:hypothetical protein
VAPEPKMILMLFSKTAADSQLDAAPTPAHDPFVKNFIKRRICKLVHFKNI